MIRSIRVHGSGSDKYDNIRVGINGRLDTVQAAILLEKLNIFDNELILRNKIAKRYSENIDKRYQKPHIPKDYFSSWAQYSVVVDSKIKRNKIIEELSRKHIPSNIYYKIPLHLQKVYRNLGFRKGDFPITESIANQILSIPMHPYLDISDQDKIIEALNNA